jgi:c-di-GMP phosphodiesterase
VLASGRRGARIVLGEVLVARQPLVDANLEVVGYELLYRDEHGRAPDAAGDGIRATARVIIDGLLGLGGTVVGPGEDAYVNVPIELLLSDTLIDLPPTGLVLELVDDAEDTTEVRETIQRHREAGFRFALDDLVPGDPRRSLLDAVDLVKVDVQASGAEALGLIRELAQGGRHVVAEKVEDPAEFDRVITAGARLVQGFFFTRPRAVRSMRPTALRAGHLELLDAIARAEVDFNQVEQLIRSDMTLTDRFLRLVDVAAGWREVESVRHGLVMLGQRAVHRWVTLLVMSAATEDAPSELLTVASVRARYCEVLAELQGAENRLEAFSVGMFSVLGDGGILDDELLASLPLRGEAREALKGAPGPLRDLIELQLAAEAADWDQLVAIGRRLGIEPRQLAAAHVDALTWASALKAAV